MFLAVDTVFDQCSVAIMDDSLQVLSHDTKRGGREQTKQILPMIDTALQQAGASLGDITALIFNRGPGAFSGIRINTAVVQALAVAHDLPTVGVSSLAAIAQSAYDEHGVQQVYAALDARMKQVYFGAFSLVESGSNERTQEDLSNADQNTDFGVMTLVTGSEEQLLDYEQSTDENWALAGNGASLLTAKSDQLIYPEIQPDAVCIAKLGIHQYRMSGGVPPEQALPVYLRNHAWKTLKEQGKA